MDKIQEYEIYYRNHLLNDIMPFWDKRCIDKKYGGYQINFNRTGEITDTDKYVWFQGRQTYIYGYLYNQIEKREVWLENAKWGYDYLKAKAYNGEGRFNYQLDLHGNIKVGTTSVFADCFALQGISEYLRAIKCKDAEGMNWLNVCYDMLERNIMDPTFKDIYENTWSEKFIWHDLYLTALSAADTISDVLGEKRTKKLIDYCLDKILNWFARDEYKLVFEAVTCGNEVSLEETHGSFINPGHALESMWFCMHIGHKRRDQYVVNRASQMAKWIIDIGVDKECGGIFSYLDATGKEPVAIDWFKETNSLWDDKVWWAHSESLCCFAMGYIYTGENIYLSEFGKLHAFCKDNFFDKEYGEWYERLHRNGAVKIDEKGTMWKCSYHLVRALINIINIFEDFKEH